MYDGGKVMKKEKWTNVIGILVYAALRAFIGLLFSEFVLQRVYVNGASMEPNYHDGDSVFMRKQTCFISYGDVVILEGEYKNGEHLLIKRVVGCPGDTIEISDSGDVFRNGELLNEAYIMEKITSENRGNFFSVVLGDDEYFVMGDNRNNSWDSRMIGPIKKEKIEGIVIQ